jgi:hypothetical protein
MNAFFIPKSYGQKPYLNKKQVNFKASMINFVSAVMINSDEEIIQPSFYKKYLYTSNPFLDSTSEQGCDYHKSMQYTIIEVKKYLLKNGLEDLDLAPIEFFKTDTVFKKWIQDEHMQKYFQNIKENVLAFYKKSNPEQPICLIRFEPNTNKIYTWLTANPYSIIFFLYPEKPTI